MEEMVHNTISYGFPDGKKGSVDMRLICRDDEQVIRFRDDGIPFDPLEWYRKNSDEDPASGMGIRMVMELAEDVHYMETMEMNNLIVKL